MIEQSGGQMGEEVRIEKSGWVTRIIFSGNIYRVVKCVRLSNIPGGRLVSLLDPIDLIKLLHRKFE